jgi:hypothetical protein
LAKEGKGEIMTDQEKLVQNLQVEVRKNLNASPILANGRIDKLSLER